MPITCVATLTPVPEHREAVLAALQAAVPAVHEEPGCELYALHRSKTTFVVIEQWVDGDALQAHGAGESFTTLTAALEGLLAEPMDVQFLQPVPMGSPDLGQLA